LTFRSVATRRGMDWGGHVHRSFARGYFSDGSRFDEFTRVRRVGRSWGLLLRYIDSNVAFCWLDATAYSFPLSALHAHLPTWRCLLSFPLFRPGDANQ